jgi:ppGpp synthetase/RelA/SpoT-type nucleotidyltranferase
VPSSGSTSQVQLAQQVERPYQHIDPTAELIVRREFSRRLERYKVLKKWIDDAVGQMVRHDPLLYRHSVRIKEVESVLGKIEKKKTEAIMYMASEEAHDVDADKENEAKSKARLWQDASVSNPEDFEEKLEPLIDDWVGCRIISYLQNRIFSLHEEIMGHRRFVVTRVTVHEPNGSNLFSGKLSRQPGCEYEHILNDKGYAGVHYIIKPRPADSSPVAYLDPCFQGSHGEEPRIFSKFELQVRTLIQEAWSQVQHDVVYKGKEREREKIRTAISRFESLSNHLAACDKDLDFLVKEYNPELSQKTAKQSQSFEETG